MIKDFKLAKEELQKIFPNAGISMFDWKGSLCVDIVTDEDEPICFKFIHMPLIAQILDTEKLNFQQHNGDHLIDSVTFNGCNVLRIIASY